MVFEDRDTKTNRNDLQETVQYVRLLLPLDHRIVHPEIWSGRLTPQQRYQLFENRLAVLQYEIRGLSDSNQQHVRWYVNNLQCRLLSQKAEYDRSNADKLVSEFFDRKPDVRELYYLLAKFVAEYQNKHNLVIDKPIPLQAGTLLFVAVQTSKDGIRSLKNRELIAKIYQQYQHLMQSIFQAGASNPLILESLSTSGKLLRSEVGGSEVLAKSRIWSLLASILKRFEFKTYEQLWLLAYSD